MRTLALTLCLLGIALGGFAQTIVDSLEYDGNVRSYRLHFPNGDSAATGLPLVLNMHGITSNAVEQEFYTEMNGYADTAGYVVCYPNGLLIPGNNTGNQRQWNVGFPGQPATDDVGFLVALVDSLTGRYGLDTARVFASGFSNGGFMAYQLACQRADRFAAIASVAGGIVPDRVADCAPEAPVPVMQIHGTDDQTVLFNGNDPINQPIDSTVALWVRLDSCDAPPVVTPVIDRAPADRTTSTRTVYAACAAGARVEYIITNGSGHSWPGASFPRPGIVTTQDFEASQEILAFFDRFPRVDTGTTGVADLLGVRQNPSLPLYPNPSAGTSISTDAATAPRTFELYTAAGQRLATIDLPAGQTTLSFAKLPAGTYVLRDRAAGGGSSLFNVR